MRSAHAQAALFVDAHVHIHPCYSILRFLNSVVQNMQAAAKASRCDDQSSCLLLTESEGVDVFSSLRRNTDRLLDEHWTMKATDEDCSIILSHSSGRDLIVIAGRQIVTRERLEVLALGSVTNHTDGDPIHLTVQAIAAEGALPVLPWGVGKWLGKRGRIVRDLIDQHSGRDLYLGDNGNRPALTFRPPLFARAERRNMLVLPGSDPLGMPPHESRGGSFGFVLPDWESSTRPYEMIKARLESATGSLETFGGLATLRQAIQSQFALRWRKYTGTAKASPSA